MRVYEIFTLVSDDYLTIDVFTSTPTDLHYTIWKGCTMDIYPWLDLEVKLIYVEDNRLCIGV